MELLRNLTRKITVIPDGRAILRDRSGTQEPGRVLATAKAGAKFPGSRLFSPREGGLAARMTASGE